MQSTTLWHPFSVNNVSIYVLDNVSTFFRSPDNVPFSTLCYVVLRCATLCYMYRCAHVFFLLMSQSVIPVSLWLTWLTLVHELTDQFCGRVHFITFFSCRLFSPCHVLCTLAVFIDVWTLDEQFSCDNEHANYTLHGLFTIFQVTTSTSNYIVHGSVSTIIFIQRWIFASECQSIPCP